jgi:hypothetical protein
MPSGVPDSNHTSLMESWRERTPQAVLRQKEQRIRERVADLYADCEKAKGVETTRLVRRCLIEAQRLCELAETTLRKDWLRALNDRGAPQHLVRP